MDRTEVDNSSVDAYIASFPADIREQLQTLRATIRAAAPDAVEKISYGMPTFALDGNLVHFAAARHHLGLYPTSNVVEVFHEELAQYDSTKGSIHFPLRGPLPLELIGRIVRYRVEENRARAAAKRSKRKT